ncbi:MAG TPA: threonine/serine dehydratase [Acidobacteriaceae bacterium]|nr:threonine/serine dehydratase [Acidobacteriaceae bacterium]
MNNTQGDAMLVANTSGFPALADEPALISLQDVRAAQVQIRGVARRTPIIDAEFPGRARIFLKAESMQPIGSFKLRGAYNKAALLTKAAQARGLLTYSSGNHAQGVAYAARSLQTRAIIVMPSNAPQIKRKGTEALGAEIITVGPGSLERKTKAEELEQSHGYAMIPPYDDPAIIAGQGTCGLEILEDLPEVDLVLAPIGGGGLLSGVAAAIKLQHPGTKVWGVEPEAAADAAESLAAGKIIAYSPEQTSRTLADGLRTQHVGQLNFAHLRAFVDGILTVTEAEIVRAMRECVNSAHLVAEPSGAVALAAALYKTDALRAACNLTADAAVCVIISGGNVDPGLLAASLQD